MKIASFDIGIRNLAYCIIEVNEDEDDTDVLRCGIKDWKIISLCEEDEKCKKVGLQTLCTRMGEALDGDDEISLVDEVVLENQPVHMNPKMKSIQMMLFTYFVLRGVPKVACFSAKNKLKVYDGPPVECTLKSKYARTKKLGIAYCKYMIRNNNSLLEIFEAEKKKDDLADSCLQGLLYLLRAAKKSRVEII